jgi:hypothetical protein
MMKEPSGDSRTSLWFRRLGRGIAVVGPALLVALLVVTLLGRLLRVLR